MSSYSENGKIAVVEYRHSAMNVSVHKSIKEMVQHYLAENAEIAPNRGGWGSRDHLQALEETKDLLDRTVALVREEVEREEQEPE